ncbi:MAG: hypothetical protein ACKVS9_18890 [Phycisphaerae bacterium]
MSKFARFIVAGCLSLGALPAAFAQDDGNAPPFVTIISWLVQHADGTVDFVLDPNDGTTSILDVLNYQHLEADTVGARLLIQDPDWVPTGPDDDPDDEETFLRFQAFDAGVFGVPPQAPPIPQASDEYEPREGDGFRPREGVTFVIQDVIFFLPEFIGRNQLRLRDPVNFRYDVSYLIEFCVANDRDPEELQFNCDFVTINVIENPALRGLNPIPFADAGADQEVATGDIVRLDGSRTFDSFNVGFDPNRGNVFELDRIQYTWEWLSGPVEIRPDQFTQASILSPIATVQLVELGDYEFRLIVDDGENPGTSSDIVKISVKQSIATNTAPTAIFAGPSGQVSVGSIITLDARSSSDPDAGTTLTYRWVQTNALGESLVGDDLLRAFQPLSGVDSPISTWQALAEGKFFFRLLVSDGRATSSVATPSDEPIVVVESSTDASRERDGAGATGDLIDAINPAAAPMCGAGLTPMAALALLGLTLARKR